MNWLTGSRQGEAKKLIAQLADATKRERAAQDLIRMSADAVPALIEALQTKDENLLPLYQQLLARIPSASPALIKILQEAILVQMLNDPEREVKKQVIQSLGELKDPRTLPALQEIASNRADRKLHTLAKEAISKMN